MRVVESTKKPPTAGYRSFAPAPLDRSDEPGYRAFLLTEANRLRGQLARVEKRIAELDAVDEPIPYQLAPTLGGAA